MTVAPELFDPAHARAALATAEKALLGALGMRTLDPDDWNFRPNYVNGVDSEDFQTSRGFNYHQGPEWLWPTGCVCKSASPVLLLSRPAPVRLHFAHISS